MPYQLGQETPGSVRVFPERPPEVVQVGGHHMRESHHFGAPEVLPGPQSQSSAVRIPLVFGVIVICSCPPLTITASETGRSYEYRMPTAISERLRLPVA